MIDGRVVQTDGRERERHPEHAGLAVAQSNGQQAELARTSSGCGVEGYSFCGPVYDQSQCIRENPLFSLWQDVLARLIFIEPPACKHLDQVLIRDRAVLP